MANYWKPRLWCWLTTRHANTIWIRNIHGDRINILGGKRSEWMCRDCGTTVLGKYLFHPESEAHRQTTTLKQQEADHAD